MGVVLPNGPDEWVFGGRRAQDGSPLAGAGWAPFWLLQLILFAYPCRKASHASPPRPEGSRCDLWNLASGCKTLAGASKQADASCCAAVLTCCAAGPRHCTAFVRSKRTVPIAIAAVLLAEPSVRAALAQLGAAGRCGDASYFGISSERCARTTTDLLALERCARTIATDLLAALSIAAPHHALE